MTQHQQDCIQELFKSGRKFLVLYLDCSKCMTITDGMAHISPAEPNVGFGGDYEIEPGVCSECKYEFNDDDMAVAIERAIDIFREDDE